MKGEMKEYEVLVDARTPCGGSKYKIREFEDVVTDDPEQWVKDNGRYPIMEIGRTSQGDVIITTGDAKGYRVFYTFT